MNRSPKNTSRQIYSVSELNRTVRQLLDSELPSLWLEGEISNLARPASGHWYFSLKDENAQIRCAMFKRANARINFSPENGDKVLVRGKIGLYEPRGDYQLIVDMLEDAGTGALQRAFEALRDKLMHEGLFAAEHKQALPELPHTVGVITSSTGAALHDILHVLKRRMPLVSIIVYPVLVQGEQAPAAISKAIKRANREQACDVLIVGRGGGSLEDLWAFNDEAVARAAFACSIPMISAVGHEVDFTILDFVADVRAPTPSAAAELATPLTQEELNAHIVGLQQFSQRLITQRLQQSKQKLAWLNKRLQLAHPGHWVTQQQQSLDSYVLRLQKLLQQHLSEKKYKQQNLANRLQQQSPHTAIQQKTNEVLFLGKRLQESVQRRLRQNSQSLSLNAAKLNTLSPLATLDRGYALVQHQNTKLKSAVVSSVKEIKIGNTVSTRLKDGEFEAEIKKITPGK